MTKTLPSGYLATPQTDEKRPGVLVLHAWWGLNDIFKQCCDRLAEAGFVAFAPDMYGGRIARTIEEAEALEGEIYVAMNEGEDILALVQDAIAALRQHPQVIDQPVGMVGFSMGAFYGLWLLKRTPEQVGALALFYGALNTSYPAATVPVQGHFAENDPYSSAEERQALEIAFKTAGIPYIFYVYADTGHWFFEANRPDAYDPDAATLAWQRTVDFLREKLGG